MIAAQKRGVQSHLKPGELIICRDARLVTTILGSCVAVTMFSARAGLAAICHAMLPEPRSRDAFGPGDLEQFRYVNLAIQTMTEAYRNARVGPGEIEVKLFGGAQLIQNRDGRPVAASVGEDNVRMARRLLREARLHLKASNVGGAGGRKIIFNTGTGAVLHKHLS